VTDFQNWDADMDAWGLTDERRTYHLRRLHAYHSALTDKHIARYERTSRLERWFALASVIALVVLVVQSVAGGAR
jgi:hypothetical protein